MSFLRTIQKKIQNPNSSLIIDGIVGDLSGFIDTGSFSLNSIVSGSMFKGFPDNKITILAGPEATGKSFILLTTFSKFLKDFPKGSVVLFESESAQRKEQFEQFDIDTSRVLFIPVQTVQEFRFNVLQILEEYGKLKIDARKEEKLLLALDSLGNLSTSKEMEDSASGKETQDMTRAKLIKSTFRTITLKLGILSVPLICTNHTYLSQGLFSTTEMGGGCLLPETNIVLQGNVVKPIKDIQKRDWVLTGGGPARVTTVWTPETLAYPTPECVKVMLSSGEHFSCSKTHQFWNSGKWIEIKDCKEGMVLTGLTPLGQVIYSTIASIIPIGHKSVYDLEIEGVGHYIIEPGFLFSHNSGPKFNASTVIYLSKKKEKDGMDVIGNIVHVTVNKSRFTKEGSKIDTFINFNTGLERYYGLLEVGVEAGLIQEKGRRFEFPNGMSGFKKTIRKTPEQFFTQELLEDIDKVLGAKFNFGSPFTSLSIDEVNIDNENEEEANDVDF